MASANMNLVIAIEFKFTWMQALKMRLAGVDALKEYLRLIMEQRMREDESSADGDNDAIQF